MPQYLEPALETNFKEFRKVVESRRSVRKYTDESIPREIIDECLDMALMAPNSSNLQPWEFHVVESPEKRERLAEICLGQQTATTAPLMIAVVERRATWRKTTARILKEWPGGAPPKIVRDYYGKLTHVMYTQGPFDVLGRAKKVGFTAIGAVKPIMRKPVSGDDMDVWAAKSCALASAHLMLAFRAAGFDTCPMEGFDNNRANKLLKLPSDATINMIISVGRRAEDGVFAPRYRLPREEVIHYV